MKKHIRKIAKTILIAGIAILVFSFFSSFTLLNNAGTAYAQPCFACPCAACGCTCAPKIQNCDNACWCQSNTETPITIQHITDEFIQHREWLIKVVWEAHVLPAMMKMTEQITVAAIQQVEVIGTFFDAKHQLETQRLLQEMQAQAHKDYQPSEGMCQFGTTTRSLAASGRNADIAQISLAARSAQRQLLSGDGISSGSKRDDIRSRLVQFRNTYCNPKDAGNGFELLCESSDVKRYNKDVNFTHTVDSAHTLKIDFVDSNVTEDEEDILAISANLYGHKIMPRIGEDYMSDQDGNIIDSGAFAYMRTRAQAAKRSVAQAAFAAQVGMKAQGEKEVLPYMEAILKEMGIGQNEISEMLGDRPSYYAQMEVLTNKLYQNPTFYSDLYDKPANIDRKNVSMMAFDLMQRRDMYRSRIRSEAMMAVWLETALRETEDLYVNEANPLKEGSKILDLPGL